MSHEAMVRSVSQRVNTAHEDHLYRAETVQLLKRIVLVVFIFSLLLFLVSKKEHLVQVVDHPISKIKITGEFKSLKNEHIQNALAGVVGGGFMMTDLNNIKIKAEQLPWVRHATVSRLWPGEIELVIQEQVPVSYWNGDSLLNAEGDVFTPEFLEVTQVLPTLIGLEEKHTNQRVDMLKTLTLLENAMKRYEVGVSILELKPRGVWLMTLDNGIAVELGGIELHKEFEKNQLSARLERVGKIFSNSQRIDIDAIDRIDARYPNGVAIKWKKMAMVADTSVHR